MPNTIECPNCHEIFNVEDREYAMILSQVRDRAFSNELEDRTNAMRERFNLEKELAVTQVKADKDKEIFQMQLDAAEKDNLHKLEIDRLNEDIERLKNYRFKNNKLAGESLEQHCAAEFNSVRASMFPRAFFEKDTKAVEGTEGDFIYRDYDEDGKEIISIMFEMKAEMENATVAENKKKNIDYLPKLDKDRNNKNCDYAVLVTTREPESELYNRGIVDFTYQYDKMYAIRPDMFIPFITLLRNEALRSVPLRNELLEARKQSMDIVLFKKNLEEAQSGFAVSFENGAKNIDKAIANIDVAIKKLSDSRDALETAKKQFNTANGKIQDLTVKRLCKGTECLAEKFEEVTA